MYIKFLSCKHVVTVILNSSSLWVYKQTRNTYCSRRHAETSKKFLNKLVKSENNSIYCGMLTRVEIVDASTGI